MAESTPLGSKFGFDPHEKVTASDLGESWGDGFFVKKLAPKVEPTPPVEEREIADPVEVLRPKTVAERQDMPRVLAARLMDYYIEELNNDLIMNPIRDGLPQCYMHRFPPGCYHGCSTGILPRKVGASLGEVFTWVQGLIRVNFKAWVKKNPQLGGYRSPI